MRHPPPSPRQSCSKPHLASGFEKCGLAELLLQRHPRACACCAASGGFLRPQRSCLCRRGCRPARLYRPPLGISFRRGQLALPLRGGARPAARQGLRQPFATLPTSILVGTGVPRAGKLIEPEFSLCHWIFSRRFLVQYFSNRTKARSAAEIRSGTAPTSRWVAGSRVPVPAGPGYAAGRPGRHSCGQARPTAHVFHQQPRGLAGPGYAAGRPGDLPLSSPTAARFHQRAARAGYASWSQAVSC